MLTFFDCNCMLGRLTGVGLALRTARDLLRVMAHHNITRALVFHAPYGPTYENELLLESLAGEPALLPAALAAPWETSRERLTGRTREILESKACAIRLFPVAEHFDFSESHLGEIMALAAGRRLPVMVDADQLGGFGALAQMLQAHPTIPFILTKVGCGNNRHVYDLLDRHSNLHVETSLFRAFQGLEDLVARFGADRILFGSYLPLLDPGAAVTRLLYSDLGRTDKERIAFGNLEAMVSSIRS